MGPRYLFKLGSLLVFCIIVIIIYEIRLSTFYCPYGEQTIIKGEHCTAITNQTVLFPFRFITCEINGHRKVDCLTNDSMEVFMPFHGFIKNYFQVSGSVRIRGNKSALFEFTHSSAKIHQPSFKLYLTEGSFGHFANYNVAERERILSSMVPGVPMSIQWSAVPYFYPVQVSQFGLEHYSRSLIVFEKENAEKAAFFRRSSTVSDGHENAWCFSTLSSHSVARPVISLSRNGIPTDLVTLRFSLLTDSNVNFTIFVRRLDTSLVYRIHYNGMINEPIRILNETDVLFGLGTLKRNVWQRFTRDLHIDVLHGQQLASRKKMKRAKLPASSIIPLYMSFDGQGCICNVTLQPHAHLDNFFDTANWLVKHQDSFGGWPVPVKRVFASNLLSLEPGWYSAMAQGHAMSVLCRAFLLTKKQVYLLAARRAAEIFARNASSGGILNYFLSTVPWYEEYPTIPGTFVLNGFIYSLIGLYDLMTCTKNDQKISELYRRGLQSLNALLPLFDTGSGSLYDLRHVALQTAPNVARWDYHSVHIFQLLWLYAIEGDKLYSTTADRWIRFSRGERAKHN
ncbi:D glucuronyl C5 epimerase [Trichuris trichiura]|uniref:heparosan-N-sulfate-glucuronate 5-epimerase n=1 Tax=Trichuris trichiura TaxID=36087 RepID=A0A077YZF2_TRITR|nr:D glucuronyl C5 epimerase [Trichuris trichiura]